MKIYVLMPTYNDADSIVETLQSLMIQTYKNWELIIVDDGSSDNTKETVENFCKENDLNKQIKYVYQENKDQLNALKNACNYIKDKNSLVYILHSDDLLNNEFVFSNAVNYMMNNNYDAIISDAVVIDEKSNVTGLQKVKKYQNKKYILPLQLLWLGRNLYIDFAFFRSEVFLKNVYNNYLNWNGPFWLNLNSDNILNVKKVDFNFFKYRVFEGNYINNKLGKLCVINGEIRVVSRLLKNYYIPLYKIQYILYRIFNKLKLNYYPLYFHKETKDKAKIIEFVLNKRFSKEEIEENLFLNALLNFYKNINNTKNKVVLDKIDKITPIYYGSDLRIFNKQILNDSLPKIYKDILVQMNNGFNKIIVKDKKDYDKVVEITKFLSIYPYVDIEIKRNK